MSTERVAPCLYGAHVHAHGIRQHYLRFGGHGQPLIVVPGITSPAATWAFVGERLGCSHDTYILDVRGRGLSEAGAHLHYDLESCANDVAEFATMVGLRDYAVLGHSLGARIAARLASRPDVPISRLVLVDPPLSGPGRRAYARPLRFYLDAIEEATKGRLDAAAMRPTYPNWSEEQLRARAEWLHTCDESAITASVRGFQEEEIQSAFPKLRMPTLLLAAGRGGVITDEDVSELRGLMPSLEVRRIDGAGHMIPFDDLETFIEVTLEFLGR